jgi:hypothetical protein
MLDTIKTLLDFGKTLFGFKADLGQAELERRKRIADYLDQIADSLRDTVAGFSFLGGKPRTLSERCVSHGKARLIEVGWLSILPSNREAVTAEINTLSEAIDQQFQIQQFCP